MDAALVETSGHLKLNSRLYKAALRDLSLEELHRRPGAETSSIFWVAGHLAASRCRMVGLLGGEIEFQASALFARGSRVLTLAEYPQIGQVTDVWDEATSELSFRIESVSLERLAEKIELSFPVGDGSLCSAIAFLTYHETYHVGQMGMLRRLLGYEGLVG